jgi:transcriptional regulator with XRE-family HTH domain
MAETGTIPLSKRRTLLRRFRKQYGITLDELGDLTDLSKSMLSLFENGERDLSPEAWTRVLTTMSNLITEDNAKRLAEIDKVKETAAKLGAWPQAGDILTGERPFGFLGIKSDEQIAKEKAEIDAERIRLQEARTISEIIGAEAERQAQELLETTATGESLEKKLTEFMANNVAPKLFQYAKELEQERDELKARNAHLEQELHALKADGKR